MLEPVLVHTPVSLKLKHDDPEVIEEDMEKNKGQKAKVEKEKKESKKREAPEMEEKEVKKGKKEFLGYDLSSNKGKNHLKNKYALDPSKLAPTELPPGLPLASTSHMISHWPPTYLPVRSAPLGVILFPTFLHLRLPPPPPTTFNQPPPSTFAGSDLKHNEIRLIYKQTVWGQRWYNCWQI